MICDYTLVYEEIYDLFEDLANLANAMNVTLNMI